jgi:hypothetical protein
MIFKSSPVFPDVIVIEPEVQEDERGFFTEIYYQEKFEAAGSKRHQHRVRPCLRLALMFIISIINGVQIPWERIFVAWELA